MIVFDLRCGDGHVFEAWFGSTEAYDSQQQRGLVCCPLCNNCAVQKAVMAPAVAAKSNRAGGRAGGQSEADRAGRDREQKSELQRLAAVQAEVEQACDYVGRAFASEARTRHAMASQPGAAGAAGPARGIVGETSISEAMELIEEGINVAPLPFRSRRSADA